MIQSLRQIKRRLRSVGNTEKITNAMQMVAASKLKKYQDVLGETRRYASGLEAMFRRLLSATLNFQHPFFRFREPKKTLIFLITSDSGLCGSYNYNVFETAERFLKDLHGGVSFFVVGRQGLAYLRRRQLKIEGSLGIPKPNEIKAAADMLFESAKQALLGESADQIFLMYTEFISINTYQPRTKKLLPLNESDFQTKQPSGSDLILEPKAGEILKEMIPHYVKLEIEQGLKESFVSEQVSRMVAMKQATDNAADMIESLTLVRNKARQAAITKELIEVVSGSRAQQSV
jgi:F-type H+-transporting ATPase subunit gamma